MPTMSFYQAALEVLRDAREPLGAGAIAEEAVRRGLIAPSGKTPTNSMSATLYRYTAAGDRSLMRVENPKHARHRRYILRQQS